VIFERSRIREIMSPIFVIVWTSVSDRTAIELRESNVEIVTNTGCSLNTDFLYVIIWRTDLLQNCSVVEGGMRIEREKCLCISEC